MAEEAELFSRQTAQVVVERLVAIAGQPDRNKFIEIGLVSHDSVEGHEIIHPPLWLAPTDADVVILADDSEIIQCRTHEGFRVSVFVGKPKTRNERPAKIILGSKEEQ